MAKKTRVVLICDRHRSEVDAVASIELAVDGDRRRLDLCADHLAELRHAVKPWLSTASKGRPGKARRPGRDKARNDRTAVREWARANGYEIGTRGRLPAEVLDAYKGSAT